MQAKIKLLSLLSLAQKAGKLLTGEETCERSLRAKEARLVIVCEDASDNTKSKFNKKCFYYGVPIYIILKKDELNKAIGKQNRATAVIVDSGFALTIEEKLKDILSDGQIITD